MRILIQKIEPEKIFDSIDNSASDKIIGGGKSQYASVSVSGSTTNGYAGVSLRSLSYSYDPFLNFRTSFNLTETDEGVSSRSSAYASSGTR